MIELLVTAPALFVGLVILLGLIIGSFLNVVIYRLPLMLEHEDRAACAELLGHTPEIQPRFNLVLPRSHCPQCQHPIGAIENVPLLSYLLQRGRCRHCGAAIAARYPLVELLSAVLSGIVAWHFGFTPQAFAGLLLTWTLVALSVIDLEHLLLPDRLTLPLLWLGLGFALGTVFVDLHSSVIGAMAGYASLWSVYHLFRLITGKEGMGYGDFKLLAALGAWLGWQQLLTIVLLASLVGVAVGIGLVVLRGRDHRIPLPFGPFLAAAGWLALLWGPSLTQAYLGWGHM